MTTRRNFLQTTTAGLLSVGAIRPVCAESYPARPVHLIVGFPAGYSSDVTARVTAQWLSQKLGQQFIVDNRPGAATNVATESVVRAPPDGYSLLFVTQTNAINVTLYQSLKFDFLHDITPVAGVSRVPGVMVINPMVPAKTIPEFIAYAKANPGKMNMASAGSGSFPHVAGELFKMLTGAKMLHVPYRSSYTADLLGGQVQVAIPPIPAVLGLIQKGKLRALAVTTATRSAALPDTPALDEFVPGYEASAWYGIGAPSATPRDVVSKLNNAVNAAFADDKIKARFVELDSQALPGTSAGFGKLITDEVGKWAKVVKFAGIKPV